MFSFGTNSFFSKYGFQIVILLFTLFSLTYLNMRILDSDEGFYIAGAFAFPTQLPHVNYFFTQAPLSIPYYWIFTHLPFGLLESARLGAWFFSLASVLLLYHILQRRFNRDKAIIGLALFSLNFFFIQWSVVSKTYSPVIFFIVLFLYSMEKWFEARKEIFLLLAGIAVSLGAGFRLISIGLLLPLFYFWLADRRLRPALYALTGLIGGAIPTIFLVKDAFDRFIFDSITWHGLRVVPSLSDEIMTELVAFIGLFIGQAGNIPFLYFGNIILVGLVVLSITRLRFIDTHAQLYWLTLGSLFISVLLIPFAREQYFVILLPPLVLLSLPVWSFSKRVQAVLFLLFILPTFLLVLKPLLLTNDAFSPSDQLEMRSWIRENTASTDYVFSYDPLFPILGERAGVAGMEMGASSYSMSLSFDTNKADYYHLMNREKIVSALSDVRVTAIIFPDEAIGDLSFESFGFVFDSTEKGYARYVRR